MPRKRVVDPRFFKDWELYQAEQLAGLPLRLAYEGLWAVADREGRFEWKPEQIKTDVLPYDPVDFRAILEALLVAGFVRYYEAEGKPYGWIPNFTRHQPIHPREAKSTLPEPPPKASLATEMPGKGAPKAILSGKSPPASTSTSTSTSEELLVAGATGHTNGRHPTRRPSRDPPGMPNWVAEAVAIREQHIGVIAHGKLGKILKPLVDKRGWDEVKPVWEYFCEFGPVQDYLARVEGGTTREGEQPVKKLDYRTTPQFFVENYTQLVQASA